MGEETRGAAGGAEEERRRNLERNTRLLRLFAEPVAKNDKEYWMAYLNFINEFYHHVWRRLEEDPLFRETYLKVLAERAKRLRREPPGDRFIRWSRRLSVECREVKLDLPWPPNQVKAHRFVIYDVFEPPDVPFERHVIRVVGAVERPLEVPLRELARRYPCVDVVAPFHCVTGWSVERVVWRGVQTKALLEEAGPRGPYVLAWGIDGYSASLPLEALMEEASVIAWAMNGELLPKKHGAPARLVVPTRYAWKSVKYFGALEVLEEPVPGYWEMQGYSLNADPWREERFDFGTPVMRGRRVSV